MKVTREDREECEVVLTIEVEAEEVKKAKDRALKYLANRVNIPGFRKGKAPKAMVERQVGKEYVLQETFEEIYPDAMNKALEQEKLIPVTRPVIEEKTLEDGKDVVFTATFTNQPEVTLGEYKNLNVPKVVKEVTADDIEKEVENFRYRQSKLVDAEEGATVQDKDFITLDFKGFVDGKAFEGGEGKDYPLTIGSKSFIDGFEDQLIGLKVGEEKKVNVTFPEEYHSKELAGKPAEFECTVRSIKHRELPPADDELAKKVSTFETLEELKADIEKNLKETAERVAVNEQEEKAIELAAENTKVEIPTKLIERRVDNMVNEMAMRLSQQGMTLDAYLNYAGMDIMKLRESYREDAEKRTKIDLMLNAIAEKEGIKAGKEDIDGEIQKMATAFGSSVKDVQKILVEEGRFPDLMYTTQLRKTMRFIIDNLAK